MITPWKSALGNSNRSVARLDGAARGLFKEADAQYAEPLVELLLLLQLLLLLLLQLLLQLLLKLLLLLLLTQYLGLHGSGRLRADPHSGRHTHSGHHAHSRHRARPIPMGIIRSKGKNLIDLLSDFRL